MIDGDFTDGDCDGAEASVAPGRAPLMSPEARRLALDALVETLGEQVVLPAPAAPWPVVLARAAIARAHEVPRPRMAEMLRTILRETTPEQIDQIDFTPLPWGRDDVAAMIESITAGHKKPIEVKTMEQLFDTPAKKWIIDQICGKRDVAMIFGPSGGGKTFIAVDLMWAAIAGGSFADRFQVKDPLRVMYCAGEGVGGLGQRFREASFPWKNKIPGIDLGLFRYIETAPQLFDDGGDVSMADFIIDRKLHQEETGEGIDLMIVDTLHSAIDGADENATRDMGRVIKSAKRAAAELDCAVIVIHHSNKAQTGERGNTALRAAMDCIIEVRPGAMICSKLKDGEAWPSVRFDLIRGQQSASVRWAPVDESPGPGSHTTTTIPDGVAESEDERRVFEVLGAEAHGVWLTDEQVGEKCGRSGRAMRTALKSLTDRGLIAYRAGRPHRGVATWAKLPPRVDLGEGSNWPG